MIAALVAALAVPTAGCVGGGQTFVSAPSADRLQTNPSAAVARDDGVRLVLDDAGWRYFAPYYGPVYGPGVRYADRAWADGWGANPYHAPGRWRPDLPTERMIRRALPEGVLEPGGAVAGFLYFDEVDDETRRITFEADLVAPVPDAPSVASFDVRFRARG